MIETGEYIRIKKGFILKIHNYDEVLNMYLVIDNDAHKRYVATEDISKHSKNIIDLIEDGDFVNGYLIVKIGIDPFNKKKQLFTEHWDYNWQGDGTLLLFYEENIKTIVTKEQFAQIEYKVGEDNERN